MTIILGSLAWGLFCIIFALVAFLLWVKATP